MIKPSDCVFAFNHETQQYTPEVIGLISDGVITTHDGDMIDAADVYPMDAVHTYDVSFEGDDKVFTLYARSKGEAVKLARYRLIQQAGQMGMFPAEVETAEELRLY